MEESTLPGNFLEALRAEECVLFIGSGISLWSGLPTWEGLLRHMVGFMEYHGASASELGEIGRMIDEGNLLSAASLCRLLMRPADFARFIREVFISSNPEPHEIHEIIVDLPPDSFITTNYDRLLDDAYQRVHGGLVLRPVNNNQLAEQAQIMRHGESRFIFTPHGRAENVDTIVLTSEDYRELRTRSQATVDTIRTFLVSRPVLYLGFGLRDPDFLLLKEDIAATYRGGEREHFAIMPDVGQLEKRFWREQYGINIISYSTTSSGELRNEGTVKHGELLELLRSLRDRLKGTAEVTTPGVTQEPSSQVTQTVISSVARYCENIVFGYEKRHTKEMRLTASAHEDPTSDRETIAPDSKPLKVRGKNISILDVMELPDSLVLIGPPGSGKTYAVNSFAAQLARDTLKKIRQSPSMENLEAGIPLLLSMKEYTGDIKEMIAIRMPGSLDVGEMLSRGLFTIIFDAVNEVSRPLLDTKVLANDLSLLVNRYPNNRYILTSRSLGYVPSLQLPVYHLDSLTKDVIDERLRSEGITSVEGAPRDILRLLNSPLFLNLFVQVAGKEYQPERLDAVTLLEMYISGLRPRPIEEFTDRDISVEQLLAPIAFRMIESGTQTSAYDDTLKYLARALFRYSSLQEGVAQSLLQALISEGLLVLDAEGSVGFFHQTVLEYLAALELKQRYEQDPLILDEKLDFLRWDETIMLFVSLLPAARAAEALSRIAQYDLLFASRAFETAAWREADIGRELFGLIVSELRNKSRSRAEKERVARAIKSIGTFGDKTTLTELLQDEIVSRPAAAALAQMHAKETTLEIIELLLEDNRWPSEFAEALRMLVEEKDIPQLIAAGRQSDRPLASDNVADVLSTLESDQLFATITDLMNTEDAADKNFAARILRSIGSDRAIELLVSMLSDPDPDVQIEVIFALQGSRGFRQHQPPYKDDRVVARMFELLDNEATGWWAADYLQELSDPDVVMRAKKRFHKSGSDRERLNLCAVIAKSDLALTVPAVFSALANYDDALKEELRIALVALGEENVVPRIYDYLDPQHPTIADFILNVLHFPGFARLDKELAVDAETFNLLLSLWESYDIGAFTLPKFTLAKEIILDKFNDEEYPHRERAIELVDRLSLNRGDLPLETIDWLVTKLDYYNSPWDRSRGRSPAAYILGRTSDETIVREKLMPLLDSSNEDLRSNAYRVISLAQSTLGRRFLKP